MRRVRAGQRRLSPGPPELVVSAVLFRSAGASRELGVLSLPSLSGVSGTIAKVAKGVKRAGERRRAPGSIEPAGKVRSSPPGSTPLGALPTAREPRGPVCAARSSRVAAPEARSRPCAAPLASRLVRRRVQLAWLPSRPASRSASPHPVPPATPRHTRRVPTLANASRPALGPPQQRPRAMFRVVTATVKLQLAGSVRGERWSQTSAGCRLYSRAEPSRARRYVWGSDSLEQRAGHSRAAAHFPLSGSALFFFLQSVRLVIFVQAALFGKHTRSRPRSVPTSALSLCVRRRVFLAIAPRGSPCRPLSAAPSP